MGSFAKGHILNDSHATLGLPRGWVLEVVSCESAHDVIAASPYIKGSHSETCALYGREPKPVAEEVPSTPEE